MLVKNYCCYLNSLLVLIHVEMDETESDDSLVGQNLPEDLALPSHQHLPDKRERGGGMY